MTIQTIDTFSLPGASPPAWTKWVAANEMEGYRRGFILGEDLLMPAHIQLFCEIRRPDIIRIAGCVTS